MPETLRGAKGSLPAKSLGTPVEQTGSIIKRKQASAKVAMVWRTPNAVSNAINYAMQSSPSHDAVIRVYDGASTVITRHEHEADFREW